MCIHVSTCTQRARRSYNHFVMCVELRGDATTTTKKNLKHKLGVREATQQQSLESTLCIREGKKRRGDK